MKTHLIDSSAWLEYFSDGKNAHHFAKIIENAHSIIVPTIIIYEIFKKIAAERGENVAFQIVAHIKKGTVVDLDIDLAIESASISKKYALPMADSIILATAIRYDATLWTQDSDFEKITGVRYFKK